MLWSALARNAKFVRNVIMIRALLITVTGFIGIYVIRNRHLHIIKNCLKNIVPATVVRSRFIAMREMGLCSVYSQRRYLAVLTHPNRFLPDIQSASRNDLPPIIKDNVPVVLGINKVFQLAGDTYSGGVMVVGQPFVLWRPSWGPSNGLPVSIPARHPEIVPKPAGIPCPDQFPNPTPVRFPSARHTCSSGAACR